MVLVSTHNMCYECSKERRHALIRISIFDKKEVKINTYI